MSQVLADFPVSGLREIQVVRLLLEAQADIDAVTETDSRCRPSTYPFGAQVFTVPNAVRPEFRMDLRIYIYIYVFVYMCVCIYIYVFVHVYTYIHIYIYIRMYVPPKDPHSI